MVLAAMTQLCWSDVKVIRGHTKMNGTGWIPVRLYLQNQVAGQIWPMGRPLLTPVESSPYFSLILKTTYAPMSRIQEGKLAMCWGMCVLAISKDNHRS